MKNLVALNIAFFLLIACEQQKTSAPQAHLTTKDSSDLVEFLEKTAAEFPNAIARRDSAWLKNITSMNLVFIDSDGEALNQMQYMIKRANNPDSVLASENNIDSIYTYTNCAIVKGNSHFRTTRDGKIYQLHYNYVDTYIRENNSWKLAAVGIVPINKNADEVFLIK